MTRKSEDAPRADLLPSSAWKTLGAAGAIAALSGAALYNRAKTREAERETPAIGEFLDVDGVRLHYLERGAGPPLLLLHGNGATIQDYLMSGLIDAAASRYRVIAFDRPGFGHSERPRSRIWGPTAQAEVVFKALAQIDVQRPLVLGHSWATLAALAMALDHPGAVAALVLLAGYYYPTVRADSVLLSPPAIPVIGDVLRHTLSPLAGRALAPAMLKTMFSPQPVPDNIAEWPLDLALRPSQIRAAAADTAMMVPAAAQLSKRYGELALPIVIVGGAGDKIAHFDDQSAALHRAVPGSELVTVPDAGHMVHHAAAEVIMAAVDRARELSADAAPAAAGDDLVPATEAAAF